MDVMAPLVNAGIDVNVLCKSGEAPLHRSARLGWVRKQQAHYIAAGYVSHSCCRHTLHVCDPLDS